MDVTTSIREDDGKTQVTVTLTEDEVKKHIDGFFKDIRNTRIPGFRPGKAPRKILEQAYGGHDAVYSQITSDMVNEVTPRALDQVDVIFITDPDAGELDNVSDKQGFTFTVTGDVKPTVELSSYDPVSIEMPGEHATDSEVDSQLDTLRDYYYSFEEVDRPVEEGDFVMAEIESTAGDDKVDALSSPSRLIEVGGDTLPKAFTEQLVGMKKDETKEFDWKPAEGDGIDADEVHSKVTVSKIEVKELPELDDEFAKRFDEGKGVIDSIEALRTQIHDQIENLKQAQLPDLKEQRSVKALAERIEGEVPESYVDYERQNILRDFFNGLQQQGYTFDQFLQQNGITAEQFTDDLTEQAQENAAESVALDALFDHLGLEVTDEDIDKEFQTVGDPEGLRKQWEDEGRMSVLREAIRRQKAAQWLIDNAVVTEETPGDADADKEEADKED